MFVYLWALRQLGPNHLDYLCGIIPIPVRSKPWQVNCFELAMELPSSLLYPFHSLVISIFRYGYIFAGLSSMTKSKQCRAGETTRKYIAVAEIDITNDERGKEAEKEVP